MPDAHKNLAISAVATAPSPATSGTSLVVTAAQGARFPTPPFNATVWPATASPDPANAEIVRVTAITTDTLTIARAQEGTTARAIVVGYLIAAGITAKTLTDVEGVTQGIPAGYPRSGTYLMAPGTTPTTSFASPAVNYQFAYPIVVSRDITVDRIAIEVTTLAAGALVRLGIYNDTGTGLPGTLVLDAGTVSGAATGVQEATISQFLAAGVYWLSAVAQTANPTVRAYVPSQFVPRTSFGTATFPKYLYNNNGGITGALATFVTSNLAAAEVSPLIGLRVV